jgi:hypothetical protein
MNVAFLFNRSLIVTRNDRYHKPIFAFSDGDSLYFLGDIEVALPSRLKVERFPKTCSPKPRRQPFPSVNGGFDLLLCGTPFQDSFHGMRVQANHHMASVQMMLPSETLGDRIRLAQAELAKNLVFQN